MTNKLFRNCRPDQDPLQDGLQPSDINADISFDAHIGMGSRMTRPSQHISLTAEPYVAVKYAVKIGNPIRIFAVSIDEWATAENLHDFSEGKGLKGAMAINFAKASKEWLASAVHIPAASCAYVYDEMSGDDRNVLAKDSYQAAVIYFSQKRKVNVNRIGAYLKEATADKREQDMVEESSASAKILFDLLAQASADAACGDVFAVHAVKCIVYAIIKSVRFVKNS